MTTLASPCKGLIRCSACGPLNWMFLLIASTASESRSFASTLPVPSTSKAYLMERKPEAARPSKILIPSTCGESQNSLRHPLSASYHPVVKWSDAKSDIAKLHSIITLVVGHSHMSMRGTNSCHLTHDKLFMLMEMCAALK